MSHKIIISQFLNISSSELFGYFTDAHLLEKWSSSNGMMVRVPRFKAVKGGRYRFEFTSADGTLVQEGHIRRITENHHIRMMDDEISGPRSHRIARKVQCDISFRSIDKGAEVTILQSGFQSTELARECEETWKQCLNQLKDLVKDSGPKQFRPQKDRTGDMNVVSNL